MEDINNDKKNHNIAKREAEKILQALNIQLKPKKGKKKINSVNTLHVARQTQFYKDHKLAQFTDYEEFQCLVKVKCWVLC